MAHRQLVEASGLVTATNIKNRVIGKEEKKIMLIEVFQHHNSKMEALVGEEFAPGTLERYTTSLKHTVDFLQWKCQVLDIDIRKVDHAFITEYEFYLRSIRKCSNNTAVKYIKNFGKIIRICLANGCQLGRTPMQDWQAAARKWIINGINQNNDAGYQGNLAACAGCAGERKDYAEPL